MAEYQPLDLPGWGTAETRATDEALVLALAALAERIPAARLLSLTRGADRPALQQYSTDALISPPGQRAPDIAVLAASEADVRTAMQVAQHYRVPLYPRGLGSGLSGGAIPVEGGIVLDLAPMDQILSVDPVNRSCVVQPGLTAKRLNDALKRYGLWYPPRPSSHAISSLGGNFAENAGGLNVVKNGPTRQWLLAARIALPGGDVITVGSPAPKDVAGLDLLSLLCGSEGLLGVATELTLRLTPIPAGLATQAFVIPGDSAAHADERAALAAMTMLRGPVTPRVFEFAGARASALILGQLSLGQSEVLFGSAEPGPQSMLLVETDAFSQQDALAQMQTIEASLGAHGAISRGPAPSRAEAEALWEARSQLSPACFGLGAYKLAEDICVPRSAICAYFSGLEQIGLARGLEFINYGHIGDANFHATLMFSGPDDPLLPSGLLAMEDVYRLAVSLGGSISGEHGIGLLKAPHLRLMRGQRELDLMRAIKRCFDPHGILNPGKWL